MNLNYDGLCWKKNDNNKLPSFYSLFKNKKKEERERERERECVLKVKIDIISICQSIGVNNDH